MLLAYVAEKRHVNFLEMIRVADARLTGALNCRSVNGDIFDLHEKVRAGFLYILGSQAQKC